MIFHLVNYNFRLFGPQNKLEPSKVYHQNKTIYFVCDQKGKSHYPFFVIFSILPPAVTSALLVGCVQRPRFAMKLPYDTTDTSRKPQLNSQLTHFYIYFSFPILVRKLFFSVYHSVLRNFYLFLLSNSLLRFCHFTCSLSTVFSIKLYCNIIKFPHFSLFLAFFCIRQWRGQFIYFQVFSGNVNVTPATCHCPTNIEDRKEIKKEKKER